MGMHNEIMIFHYIELRDDFAKRGCDNIELLECIMKHCGEILGEYYVIFESDYTEYSSPFGVFMDLIEAAFGVSPYGIGVDCFYAQTRVNPDDAFTLHGLKRKETNDSQTNTA